MRIAIPVENWRLNAHFGGAREFCFFDVDETTATILRSEIMRAPEHQPGLFPAWLHKQGANVVIVGGIGQRALSIFARHGMRVVAGQPEATPEALVAAYLAGKIVQSPMECAHQGQHGHDHGHGEAHCGSTSA